jgi:hypothetical protein
MTARGVGVLTRFMGRKRRGYGKMSRGVGGVL